MTSENTENTSMKYLKRKRRRNTGFEQWGGYMAAKVEKLEAQLKGHKNLEIDGDEQTEIFKGISIYVNGYTIPSADELKRLILIHGGTYHYYYSSKTTHMVASNLPDSKVKTLKRQIVVTPKWITDSIEAKKLLPYQNYFLYTPEFLEKQERLTSKNYFKLTAVTENSNSEQLNKGKQSDADNSLMDVHSETKCNLTVSSEMCQFQNDEIGGKLLAAANKSENSTSENMTNNVSAEFLTSALRESASDISLNKSGTSVKAGHPAFLSEFYSHSRLHHISAASQELKRYVQYLVDNHKGKKFSAREKLKSLYKTSKTPLDGGIFSHSSDSAKCIIMHLDMDCFFVSVGLRKHPDLIGQPVAVTHSKGKSGSFQEGSDIQYEAAAYMNKSRKKMKDLITREDEDLSEDVPSVNQKISKYSKEYGSLSEIASCSYEARKAGVRNGMFLGEAMRLCPNLKTIPYDFEGYNEVSKKLYDIVASYTLDIEAVSCDELYIDCTELLQDTQMSPLQFAAVLRNEIKEKTNCTASAGLGNNMLIARLANKCAKPNGQCYVLCEQIDEFMAKQKVGDLPGVGYSTSLRLEQLGVTTCGDLKTLPLFKLQEEFGPKTGRTLYDHCRGKDNRTIQLQKERKSVSAEINYGIRFETFEEVCNFIRELSTEVHNRLQNINCKGKSLTLKLMVRRSDAPMQTAKFMGHGVCDSISKSVSLKCSTDDPVIIGNECCALAQLLKIKPQDYRGVGIQMNKLESLRKEKSITTIESFLHRNQNVDEIAKELNKKVITSKEIEIVEQPLNTVKDFVSSKSSSNRKQLHLNINPNELDQSVLNALPDDIYQEVLEAYAMSSKLPSKTTNLLPFTNFDREKLVPKQTPYQSKNKKRSTNIVEKSVASSTNGNVSEEVCLKSKPTLGGAEHIDDIRKLIKEWVNSSEVALEEDVEELKDYLLKIIDDDLKKVDLILKCFYRMVDAANQTWKQTYLAILSHIQQKMLQSYGSMLDAKNDFQT